MKRALKLFLMILVTCIIVPIQLVWLLIPILNRRFWIIPRLWHRALIRILGIKIRITGDDANNKDRAVLYVANHQSYIDINVMGSYISGAFISKSDVAKWPVFGFLAKLQATLFIERNPRHMKKQKRVIEKVAARGTNLVLFPEGTTTDGMHVLPFKSSLFAVAVEQNTLVQPVSILYTNINKLPFTHENKDLISWYINPLTGEDMDLAPHLWTLLKQQSAEVEIHFHPPLDPQDFTHRKDIALKAQEKVARHILKHRLPYIQDKAMEKVISG